MPDLPGLDGFHDLARVVQDCIPGKPGGNGASAVHARDEGVFLIAAQLQRFGNDGGEIPAFPDVHNAGVGDDRGGEHPVRIAGPQGHDAVGGEEDGRGDVLKLPLLVLPRRAKVALEVGVFLLELRVAVGGQHFRVGVDADALARCLFQQAFHIIEVMAGDDDEWPFLDGQGHFHRLRVAERGGVGLVQKLHHPVGHQASLLYQLEQLFLVLLVGQRGEGGAEKRVDLAVRVPQHPGMIGVGRHAPQAEQHRGFQAADVLIRLLPQLFHVVIAHRGRSRTGCGKGSVLCLPDLFRQLADRLGVKVHIRDGGE